MAARDEQQQIRKIEPRLGQPRAERMAFEMVDRDQRLARGQRQRLAGDQPDHHPADQTRPGGGGDRIDRVEPEARVRQRRFDQGREMLDMSPRGDFRHHPAIRRMRRLLASEAMREDAAVAVDDRCRGLVTTRFQAEDQRHLASLPPPMRREQAR